MRGHMLALVLAATAAVTEGIRVPLLKKPPPMPGNMTLRAMRRFGGHEANATDMPVLGHFDSDGSYYILTKVGEQELALYLDTGSSDIGVSAVGCHGCTKKFHDPYNPKQSANAKPLGCDWCKAHTNDNTNIHCKKRPSVKDKQCTMIQGYADNSGFSAALWEDEVTILGSKDLKVQSVVGAIYEAQFPNPKTVDGIIGLADQAESVSGAPNFIDNLVAQGTIDNVFAMCLTNTGGHVYLGLDKKLEAHEVHDEKAFNAGLYGYGDDMMWTPRVPNVGFYAVNITNVAVGGKVLKVKNHIWNNGSAIIDSGTSDCTIPATGLKAIKAEFEHLCRNKTMCLKGTCDCKKHKPLATGIWGGRRCVHLSPEEIKAYPTIEFIMEGNVRVELTPELYLRDSEIFCEKGGYTIALGKGADNDGMILGATLMQGYMTVHDRRPPGRMGFAKIKRGDCPM